MICLLSWGVLVELRVQNSHVSKERQRPDGACIMSEYALCATRTSMHTNRAHDGSALSLLLDCAKFHWAVWMANNVARRAALRYCLLLLREPCKDIV